MAEAAAAINLGASALAFIELGYRIGVRLKDFLDASQDAPKAFKDIADRLPLLATKIGDIKTAHDIGNIDPARANALSKVVKGCERQVAELDTLLETLLPSQNNEESSAMITRLRVMSKAVRSVFKEKEVQRIQQTLQAYESTLTFYFSDISLGHAQQRQLGTGEKVTRYYVIPVLSVPKFVARKQQMNAIQEILSSSPTSNGIVRDQRKVAVILGMGGQGKTQLALEYCRTVKMTHSVFWVDATSQATATQSFSAISRLISGQDFSSPEDAIKYVLRTLGDLRNPFLLVFDNYDHPSLFKNVLDFLPQTKNCNVLFTSRHHGSKRLGEVIPLTAMTNEEGAELLLLQANIKKTVQSTNVAFAIAKKLGGLALAIDQAGSYLSARTLPLEAFDEIYEAQKLSILQLVPEVGGTYYRTLPGEERETNLSVFTTWEMSLLECGENAADREPFINLLTVAAFMGSSSVGQNFIKIYYEKVFSGPSSLTSPFCSNEVLDPLKYQDLVVRLLNVSLVQSVDLTSSSIRFSLHPLIAEWLRLRIELSKRQQYAIEVIGILKSFVEEYMDKSGHIRKASLQDSQEAIVHLNQCRRNDRMYLSIGDSISDHLKDQVVKFARFLAEFGRFSEAEELLQQGQNNCLDPELSNQFSVELAYVYFMWGKLQLAEDLTRECLRYREDTYGPEDSASKETLHIAKQLGHVYFSQNKLEAAEEIWKSVLTRQEDMWGLEDVDVYVISSKLGDLYRCQGNYPVAKQFLIRSLSGLERLLPAGSFEILPTKQRLGLLFQAEGELESARNMFQQVLIAHEDAFGPNHQYSLDTVSYLGVVFMQMERYKEAESFLKRALEGRTRVFGPEHPNTLYSAQQFARICMELGQFSLAESELLRQLPILEATLGVQDIGTLFAVALLGETYYRQNRFMLAKQMLNRARLGLEGRSETLGVSGLSYDIAVTYEKLSMYDEARLLFTRAAQGFEKLLGSQNIDTLNATKSLEYCVKMQSSRRVRTRLWVKRIFE